MGNATWTIDDWTAYQGVPYVADAAGVTWHVTSEAGWRGTPAPRLARGERPRRDGEYDGESYLSGRVIELGGWFVAGDTATRNAASDRLSALLTDGTALHALVVTEESTSRLAMVRRSDGTEITMRTPVAGEWTMVLFAPDPRRYDSDSVGGGATVISTGLPSATTGYAWPATWPLTIATGGTSGQLDAYNAGTAPSAPVLDILGPVVNPRIENLTSGLVLDFAITLGASDILTVDAAAGTVTLNDGSSIRSALTSASDTVTGWMLVPGHNSVTYRALSSAGGSTLTITYRSGYW